MPIRARVFELHAPPSMHEMLSRLRSRRALVALDSAAGSPCDWSIVAFDPLLNLASPHAIAGIRDAVATIRGAVGDAIPGPFHGGFIGALSYELGVCGEHALALPDDPWRSPKTVGGAYVDFVVRDERAGRAWLVLHDGVSDDRPPLSIRRSAIEDLLARPFAHPTVPRSIGSIERHTSADEHMRRIERLRASIAAGDLYQANLAHRSTCRVVGDPMDLYLRLRRVNPAPYMAYLAWDEHTSSGSRQFPIGALLSASPELFVECDGRSARTRPIKGTAARASDEDTDRRNAAELLASAKDKAELAMIVDLERNDLGRIARVGTVRVGLFPKLESYAGVHHLTADVSAELADGRDAIDVLEALFPGGSITGAPKVASMRHIADQEVLGRGFFTGALGFVDVRGHAVWNILIRTFVWRPLDIGNDAEAGTAHRVASGSVGAVDSRRRAPLRVPIGEVSFHVGGGITWSSDAAAEERETVAKAQKLVETLLG